MPELCHATAKKPFSKAKGAERRKAPSNQRPHRRMRQRASAKSALASRRTTADLVATTERCDSVQAALHANGRAQALPTPSVALKRGTSRAGPIAGGDDARTARERKLRALPAGTARAPFLSAQDLCNSIGDKLQGRVTQGETKYFRGGQYRQNVGWAKARSAVPTRRLLHVKVRVGFATLG